jgi:hypothetical protein
MATKRKEYPVRFVGGPWDGCNAVLPGVPSFLLLQLTSTSWDAHDSREARKAGKKVPLILDTGGLDTHVYRLQGTEVKKYPIEFTITDERPKGRPRLRKHVFE